MDSVQKIVCGQLHTLTARSYALLLRLEPSATTAGLRVTAGAGAGAWCPLHKFKCNVHAQALGRAHTQVQVQVQLSKHRYKCTRRGWSGILIQSGACLCACSTHCAAHSLARGRAADREDRGKCAVYAPSDLSSELAEGPHFSDPASERGS